MSLYRLLPLLLLFAGPALAQWNPNKPETVGIIILPFESERETDTSVSMLLEDFLETKLPRKTRQPLHFGSDVRAALPRSVSTCLKDSGCVKLLGSQFESSLVAQVTSGRAGTDLRIAVTWYATGNGVRLGKDEVVFPSGDEPKMVDAFATWVSNWFPPSLKINASTLAGEGGIVGSTGTAESAKAEELREAKKKKVSSRREDYGGGTETTSTEPREATDVAQSASRRPADDRQRRETEEFRTRGAGEEAKAEDNELPPEDEDLDLDTPASKKSAARPPADEDEGELSLEVDERRGRSVQSFEDAQRMGMGPREYTRYVQTGATFDEHLARRWAYGRRVHLRFFGAWGAGSLRRRYASLIYVRAGNVKTEEYGYESIGSYYVQPGAGVGIWVSPHDVVSLGADFSVLYAQQGLRREYVSQEFGTSVCSEDNCPPEASPQYLPTAHLVVDIGAKFFLPSTSRVKFTTGLMATVIVMQGIQPPESDTLVYRSRPTTAVFGLSPIVGLTASISHFVSLFLEIPVTIFLTEGSAKFEGYVVEPGEEAHLEEQWKEPRPKSVPVAGRAVFGAMLHF